MRWRRNYVLLMPRTRPPPATLRRYDSHDQPLNLPVSSVITPNRRARDTHGETGRGGGEVSPDDSTASAWPSPLVFRPEGRSVADFQRTPTVKNPPAANAPRARGAPTAMACPCGCRHHWPSGPVPPPPPALSGDTRQRANRGEPLDRAVLDRHRTAHRARASADPAPAAMLPSAAIEGRGRPRRDMRPARLTARVPTFNRRLTIRKSGLNHRPLRHGKTAVLRRCQAAN